MASKATLSLLFLGALCLAGCSASFTPTTQSAVTTVNVSCLPASVQPGQTSQCAVTVAGTGSYSHAVNWSALSGQISASGLYTAPSTAPASGSDTIKAVSAQNTAKVGSAVVAISPTAVQPTVTAVTVVPTPASITTAQTATCIATVTGTGPFSNAVTWTATGGTITSGGVFTPTSAGTGTCTANSAQSGFTSVSGSANITVTAAPPSVTVTSVSVVPTPASITTAQTATCAATVTGTGAYSTAVTWTATGGTITSGGVFTPSGVGAGTCTAHSAQAGFTNVSGSANITVTAAPPSVTVTSVSVVPTPASITTAQTATCAATVTGTGAYSTAVTWTATGGTITSGGVFTPSGVGTGTCTAHSAQSGFTNISGAANITVTAPPVTVTGVSVVPTPASITTAQTATCAATVTGTGAFSTAVTWTATGGTITSGGVFTPSGVGTGTCTAHSAQAGFTNISGAANITVTAPPVTVTGVSVVPTPASITTAQTATCAATVTGTGAFSTAVTWTATGGTITSGGVFTPSGVGTGTCTAHSAQAGFTNVSGAANITVTSAPFTITSINVAATPASITTAQTSTCAATVLGTGTFSSAVTWTATGGTITSGGVFTPSGTGTATCTAHSAVAGFTNISGSANVAVTAAPPAITAVSLVCTPSTITVAQTSTCTPTVTGTGAFNNTVTLSVSPSADGTLSATTGVSSGNAIVFTPAGTPPETATVTATSTQDPTKTGSATVAITSTSGGASCSAMSLGNNANLNGFIPFPATNPWNTDISTASVDPNNTAITTGSEWAGDHLHHDWSSVAGGNYGIPYVVVDSSTVPAVPINVVSYPDESDVSYAPYPSSAPIEGTPGNCVGGPTNYVGDQHVIVLDRNRCMMYETFNTALCNGNWSSDSETIWDIQNYEQRPWGWTSADAAGLPIFPGLVRYDEVAAGAINHALRFTMNNTRNSNNGGYFVDPATHAAGSSSTSVDVMGMRVRLKASFDISKYSAANQVILTAMKKYGMILADNGSNFYFQGVADSRWNDDDLADLDSIQATNFEVVQMTPAYPGRDAGTAPTGSAPSINSFTASSTTVASGTPVTLSWSTSNDSYDFIDKLGGVRGGSITITPTATTTYTLNATNQYGRTTKAVTVTVQ